MTTFGYNAMSLSLTEPSRKELNNIEATRIPVVLNKPIKGGEQLFLQKQMPNRLQLQIEKSPPHAARIISLANWQASLPNHPLPWLGLPLLAA
mmetsp:Transcript_21155/g.61528  ORF Transcript_21155/g.61528 Transcript_21155/m.61528 type:complete len:93 (-) Transcript_21155:759-1037(-)